MKRIHFLTAAAAFLALFTACQHEGDTTIINQVAKEQKTFPVVTETLTSNDFDVVGQTGMQVNLCFRQGKKDIPYICLTPDLLNKCLEKTFTLSDINAGTNSVTITNTDRSNTKAVFDLTHHTLSFENYDLFFQSPSNVYMDPAAVEEIQKAEDDNVETYLRIIDSSSIAGQPIALDWSTQDVEVVLCNNNGTYSLALPLQMFNDVFLSPVGGHLVYNGAKVYQSDKIDLAYYNTSPYSGQPRSEALAALCYNELCLNLDFNYGLKAIHGIDKFPDFDTYFASAGIKNSLKSTDPKKFANALKDVCEFYFGDGHSNYQYNSPFFSDPNYRPTGNHTSAQGTKYSAETTKYTTARKTTHGTDTPGYEISTDGKTVIVRFDEFSLNPGAAKKADRKTQGAALTASDNALLKEYLKSDSDGKHIYEGGTEGKYDTVAFIHAVNEAIKAYDTANPSAKIENVVLDMSCNGGGANHSACFVLAWMLGKCDFAFTNPITGAKWTISYLADVDMDGTFDEADDTVKDKKLFCLISPCSFSCGNMVPAMLKASDRVTILGVTSSGGSSCVQSSSAADGSIFRMSSKYVMSINKNGSNYDIDKGIDPHYFINDPENFYKKETIAELVTKINSGKLSN